MTTITILIKRNADKNYDRLFAKIEETCMFGKNDSIKEEETPGGYAVTFKSLDADVIGWLDGRPKDFEIV